jgi:divalent metal cation (Fe/Co/Zn/Cd) transporter
MASSNIAPFERDGLRRRAVRLEYFTVGWNVLEAVVALIAGIVASSIALVGFGLDSVIETVSGLALLWRFKQRGLEEEVAESHAIQVVGATFFALAAYVGYEAVSDLRLGHRPEFSLPGFVLALLSLIVMPVLGVAKRRTASKLASRALAADGMETLVCALLSAALVLGLGLNGWLGWWWADPAAGLLITAFMVREGYEAFAGESE